MSYSIGIYLRLSDDDKGIGNFKVESNSIAHQRIFILANEKYFRY